MTQRLQNCGAANLTLGYDERNPSNMSSPRFKSVSLRPGEVQEIERSAFEFHHNGSPEIAHLFAAGALKWLEAGEQPSDARAIIRGLRSPSGPPLDETEITNYLRNTGRAVDGSAL